MELATFVNALRAFADKPIDVDYDRGQLVAEIHNEIFEITFIDRYGSLFCVENGVEYAAGEWLVKRVGRFDLLARRMLEFIPDDPLLIRVEAEVVDVLEVNPLAEPAHTDNALGVLQELMGSELAGMTKVVYLTSDAGEGKTSLIDGLARLQAQRYLDRKTSWLLLPVQLGGRPFIRLDDVIVGTLSNRLRFLYYYFDSVVELVKLNALVLALDGFEEMFVETRTGEAVSSLGTLVTQLQSRGRLLVAARSAYYNYRDFEAQAKLFHSVRDADVSFAEVGLKRWSERQFMELASRAGSGVEGKQLYQAMATRLGSEHPLLTRAVLARRLIQEYTESDNREALVQRLSEASGEEYFDEFVSHLIHREATVKWVDRTGIGRHGEAARPLLSVEEHHAVLTAVAEEMWRGGVDALNGTFLEEIAELVVDAELNRPADVVHQARERITQHALLDQIEGTKLYHFDHEDFRNYYIGRRLAALLQIGDKSELRAMLEVKYLPELAVRVSAARFNRASNFAEEQAVHAVAILCHIAEAGRSASFLRANVGRLVVEVLRAVETEEPVVVSSGYLGAGAVKGARLQMIKFVDCVFERFDFEPNLHTGLEFNHCTIVSFALAASTRTANLVFDEASLPSQVSLMVVLADGSFEEEHIYDPAGVAHVLRRAGCVISGSEQLELGEKDFEPDNLVRIVDRVARYFQRTTSTNDYMLQTRLGTHWSEFESTVLPDLIYHGVLVEVPYRGSGTHRRFRLGVSFEKLERARRGSNGNYKRLLEMLSQREQQ